MYYIPYIESAIAQYTYVCALIMHRSKNNYFCYATQHYKFSWQNCDAKLEKQRIIRSCAGKVGYSANFGKVPSTLPKL